MARKKQDDTQLPLVPMTRAEYEHAAVKFSGLQMQLDELEKEAKADAQRHREDIKAVKQDMRDLAKSIKEYEKGRA